ncbi:MAG: DUF4157 domain-containing protein [Acidimicrobiia bacterium]|nr:DUF4157 domain-containing protein [Acidimicrobiia bacterium]
MPRPLLPLSLLFVGLLAACTLGGADVEIVDAGLDARIGVPEAEGVIWQREVAGETLVGITASANPSELSLITAALGQVPEPVKRQADVRNLVRATDTETLDPATLAFSRGPDIYLINRTFEGTSRLDLAYTLAHELTHVAQFNALDPGFVDQVLAGEVDSLDPNSASVDVADFSDAIGWEDRGATGWFSESAANGTTVYGASGPSEDMAESVALVATGRANELSEDRVRWVEEWTGVSAAEMARGKPWRPPAASLISSANPIYDEQGVRSLGGSRVEPLYLLLVEDGSTTQQLVEMVGSELRARGMAGVLEEIPDSRVPRFGGRMVRPGGSLLWVELWDFRFSTAFANPPPGVVLTYVDVWS